MNAPKRTELISAELRAAFKADLAGAWTYFLCKYPKHTPYAFALYAVEGELHLSAHVLTEESLTTVAQRYMADGHYDELDEARAGLRYSIPDSPLFGVLEKRLPMIDALTERYGAVLVELPDYTLVTDAASDALKELDAEGAFGTGSCREQLLLMIYIEEIEEDVVKEWVRRLNPQSVFRRFDDDTRVEGVFVSCDALAVSPDGSLLFATGSRDREGRHRDSSAESESEIYSLALRGQQMARQWTYTFPHFGDSGRQLVCSPDVRSVIMLRQRYTDEAPHAMLMRFASESGELMQQVSFRGEAASLAISADDSRLAVCMRDKTLHVLDCDFRLIHSSKLGLKPHGVLFQRSGHLLVAAEKQLLRLSPLTYAVETSVRLGSFRLVADEKEELLAVSEWFFEREKEFGVHLLRLPTLEPIRTFQIPGHQAVTAALSPDGKLLACEAHEIGSFRRFVAVFNTVTGAEVSRRRSAFIRDLTFLRDSRTLAIADARFTKSEAIALWTLSQT